jgi:tetratricopeptide (TPR) repeat protein
VGLGLIARDEEQTIPRLLASCEGAFDEVVLVDTGSKDATVERFETWAATQPGINCRVVHFQWVDDFGAARQVALSALGTDWCSWADCDDELRGAPALRAAAAAAPPGIAGLTARYDYAPTEHARHVRLVRRGFGRWHGAIHEALEVGGRVGAIPDDLVRWVHLPVAQDGPKARLRRDLEILERQVAGAPDDARAVFYLAQTHRDLGHREQAIELYERRAGMEGWDEETFYARFQAGLLLVDSDWPRAMATLIDAWEMRPERLEPTQALSANLRVRGSYEAAHLFAVRGAGRAQPADGLFVASWIYDWGMLFELSITAYWVGDLATSRAACEELLARDDLPDLHRRQTEHNRRACIEAVARRAVDGAMEQDADSTSP